MISISINVAVGAGSILMFAGFMLGYAIAWRRRTTTPVVVNLVEAVPLFVGGVPEVAPLVCDCQVPPGKHPGFAAVSCGCPIHGDAADILRGWA